MTMDRAERIGLGTAVGGHALLLGAFALGAFFTADRITKARRVLGWEPKVDLDLGLGRTIDYFRSILPVAP